MKQDSTKYFDKIHLTLSWRRPLSYRNKSIDLLCKLKMTQWWVFFQITAAVVYKARILWPLKWGSDLQKLPPAVVLQICVSQLLLKPFKNVCDGVKFSKMLKWTPFQLHFTGFQTLCKSFPLKQLLNLCGQGLETYGSKIHDIKKSVVKM